MTKAKVIEDLRKHTTNHQTFHAWLGDGYAYYYDGISYYRDKTPLEGFEYDIQCPFNSPNEFFRREVENVNTKRIRIDKEALVKCLEPQRRNPAKQFTTSFKINYKGGLMLVDAWYLRDMCEYLKDYSIWIEEDWNGKQKGYISVYKRLLIGFSEDKTSIQCLLCPMIVNNATAKRAIEMADMVIE